MERWLLDGAPADSLPISDRGLQYGDGLFETLALRNGAPRFLDRHIARLESGLAALGFEGQPADTIAVEITTLAADCDHGAAKIIVTRGSGERGYRPPATAAVRRLIGVFPAAPRGRHYYRDGIALRWCATPASSNPATAGIKTLCRVDQVLARAEWDEPDIVEGLMLDCRRRIVGGTMSNFFVVRENRLLTPSLTNAGVAGIMRGIVLDLAPEIGLAVAEADMGPDDLHADDELFVTNSQIGIWPVCKLADQSRAVGPWTRRLMARAAAFGVAECRA